MSKRFCALGMALVMVAGLPGCKQPKPEDEIVKERVNLGNKLAAAYESVTNQQSYAEITPTINSIKEQLVELDKKLEELGAERKEAALKKYATEIDAAKMRFVAARKSALDALKADAAKKS